MILENLTFVQVAPTIVPLLFLKDPEHMQVLDVTTWCSGWIDPPLDIHIWEVKVLTGLVRHSFQREIIFFKILAMELIITQVYKRLEPQ